jgi:DNA-binding transcriptional MerR regulator
VLRNRRRYSTIRDVRFLRRADCVTNDYLAFEKYRERLSVSKQSAKKSDVDRHNLKKLSEMEAREQRQIKISSRFADF